MFLLITHIKIVFLPKLGIKTMKCQSLSDYIQGKLCFPFFYAQIGFEGL